MRVETTSPPKAGGNTITFAQITPYGHAVQCENILVIKGKYATLCAAMNIAQQKLAISFAVVAWGTTVFLVYQLLSGTFESGRACQTTCFQIAYWTALSITIIGLLATIWTKKTGEKWLNNIGVIALLMLLTIFVTMMVVGNI